MWPEILTAKNEKRRELVLSGKTISERISKYNLDESVFTLTELNFLNISETTLRDIPSGISKLSNLATLVLHSNKLEEITEDITKLEKLKVLDLSRNQIKRLPDGFENLSQIVTINLSGNCLETFPVLTTNSKLSVLDLSNNQLTHFPSICCEELSNLSEINLSGNKIEEIANNVNTLPSLKVLNLSNNKIKTVPGEVADCHKLKELNLQSNPINDKRLLKLIQQCRTKQILDYVKQHCPRSSNAENAPLRKGKKGKNRQKSTESQDSDESTDFKCTISIRKEPENCKVIVEDSVKNIREHIVCCLVNNIQFTEEKFKKFIQVQNKLHDGICNKRNSATIATHDYKKMAEGEFTYTTLPPADLKIKPLNRPEYMTGAELFSRLQTEANNLRKEKKRNTYSGIHKYLYLIEGKPVYPCLLNSKNEVVSFPPITNSDVSKIEVTTTQIFIEITSSTSQLICKNVLTELLKEMVLMFENLEVQQVRCIDKDENKLKVVFPSKTDLNYEKELGIKVVRD